MFGTKKLGEKLATWFEKRSKAYAEAIRSTSGDPRLSERMAIASMVLADIAAGIREVTGAATKEELGEDSAEQKAG